MDEELRRSMKKGKNRLYLITALFILASLSAYAGFFPGEYPSYEQKTQMTQGVFMGLLVFSFYSVMWTLAQFAAFIIAWPVKRRLL
jgi:hypothetical protein